MKNKSSKHSYMVIYTNSNNLGNDKARRKKIRRKTVNGGARKKRDDGIRSQRKIYKFKRRDWNKNEKNEFINIKN